MTVIECSTTHLNTDVSEYIWIIEDFPLLRTLATQRALPNYDRIMSPKFGDQHNGIWFLALFPAGVNCDGNLLSIYLFTSSDEIKVALFEISILDEEFNVIEGSTASLSQPRVFSKNNPSWGWEDYMQIKCIKDSQLTSTNNLNVQLTTQINPFPLENNVEGIRSFQELIYSTEEDFGANLSYSTSGEYEDINSDADTYTNWEKTILKYFVFDGKIRIKLVIKSYSDFTHTNGSITAPSLIKRRNLTQDFLWLAKDFSKFSSECSIVSSEIITINCGEDCFRIPKFTLAARSRYFQKMFVSNFLDSEICQFSIPNEETKTFIVKNALDYISTGDCELLNRENMGDLSDIIDLFKFSDKYGVDSLYNSCIPIIIANINIKSIWKIMIVAQQCNSLVLLKAINDFLKSNNDISSLATTLVDYLKNREKLYSSSNTNELNIQNECNELDSILNLDIKDFGKKRINNYFTSFDNIDIKYINDLEI